MTLHLKIDANQLTWEELEALEAEGPRLGVLRTIVAKMMVDENDKPLVDVNGAPLTLEARRKLLAGLTLAEIREVAERLRRAFQGLRDEAIPPTTGDA
jgi:hypothetical protein